MAGLLARQTPVNSVAMTCNDFGGPDSGYDLTRVIVNELGAPGNYSFLNIFDNSHTISHWDVDPSYPGKYRQANLWFAQQYAYFLSKMDSIVEANGKTLLDNSMILFGAGINMSGGGHIVDDMPLLLAGSAGGQITSGRSIDNGVVKIANLYMAMLKILGYTGNSFGDSDGIVSL